MSVSEIRTVAVVGTGTIGASWASLFLAKGLTVRCYDPSPDAEKHSRAFVERAWSALAQLAPVPPLDHAQARLSHHPSVETAVDAADFVQENTPELLDLKRKVLTEIEAGLRPDVVIASSTSGLMPSTMQETMARPERFLVGHPFNPPHLLPLVEVVGGRHTSAQCVTTAMEFYGLLGKRAIHIRKEINGHVANRLQAALWREAVFLAAENVASVADIDAAVASGPGLRWALMGPHLTLHLAGGEGGIEHFVDHLGPAFTAWWAELGTPTLDPSTRDLLVAGISQGVGSQSVAQLAEDRDKALIKLLRAIKPLS
ncbi:3-hydroxyacyl-CoA dehydrogenase NAD-binding domain-containing protein [Devosia algicola]|uniref:3-hydroxyacyl-CoA dehydrogenase NAD-binding domain-containing protein n=1 Tax=Devosia algicola TaxID=3026418 RepID=A0ABY7YPE3_9HYPH|nr:3-hydroxyacyl-CoA dehydrogenase NAD-binding domain-containing protein [Devosia algicola]WDR03124.1 3-hydroxyacyl-CoA dehydrogenase NAD-binding domain-containing protein [Devosia algicola]